MAEPNEDKTTDTRTGADNPGDGGEPNDNNGQLATQQPEPQPDTPKIELTPDQLDERLNRARETTTKQLLDDLGFEDADGLKSALGQFQKLRKEKLSEEEQREEAFNELTRKLEKAQAKTQDVAAEWEGKYNALQGEYNDLLTQQAFQAAAKKHGFRNLNDPYKLADMSGVSIDEDGQVKGVEEAVEALAEEREDLLDKAPAHDINAGAGRGAGASPSAGPDLNTLLPSRLAKRVSN